MMVQCRSGLDCPGGHLIPLAIQGQENASTQGKNGTKAGRRRHHERIGQELIQKVSRGDLSHCGK